MTLSNEEVALVRRARHLVQHRKRMAPLSWLIAIALLAFAFHDNPQPTALGSMGGLFVLFWLLRPETRGAPTYEELVDVLEGRLPARDPIIAALEER